MRLFFWTVGICLLTAGQLRAAAYEDVLKILRDNEAYVRSLSVKTQVTVFQRTFNEPRQDVNLKLSETIIVDSQGRCRVETDGESFTSGSEVRVYPEKAIGVFDGHSMQTMSGERYFDRGLITSNRSDLPMRLDPLLAITHYFDKPVTVLLSERPGASIGRETTWEGRPALELHSAVYDNEGDDRQYRITVVPELNYAIVRRATAVRYDGLDRWDDYTRIITSDYFEAQPGFWLPRQAIHESFEPTREQATRGTDPDTSWRWNVSFTDWQLNPEISDSAFAFKFASGVYVNDQVVGRSYKMSGVSDELIDTQLTAARTWKSQSRTNQRQILLIVNVTVVALILAMIAWRRFTSRTPKSPDSRPE